MKYFSSRLLKSGVVYLLLTSTFLSVSFLLAKPTLSEEKNKAKDFDYWASLCKSLGDEKKYDEAITACDQAVTIKPKEPGIWSQQTQVFLGANKYAEGLVSAGMVLRLKPKSSLALVQKCQALNGLAKYAEAIATCDLALRGDGNWGEATASLALFNQALAESNLA